MKRRTITLASIIGILTVMYFLQGIIGIPQIKDWDIFRKENKLEITIKIEPENITEGKYQEIPFTITLTNTKQQNITSLTLLRNNAKIDRLHKNNQISVALLQWKDAYNDLYVFLDKKFPSNYQVTASGVLIGCENCFFGEESPYQLIITLEYSKDNGAIEPVTLKILLPII